MILKENFDFFYLMKISKIWAIWPLHCTNKGKQGKDTKINAKIEILMKILISFFNMSFENLGYMAYPIKEPSKHAVICAKVMDALHNAYSVLI